jgi:hypothetical protein
MIGERNPCSFSQWLSYSVRKRQSNGITPDKGQSVPNVEEGRLRPWRENGLKKRAIAKDMAASPRKNGKNPVSIRRIRSKNVNRSCRLVEGNRNAGEQDQVGAIKPDSRLSKG